MSMSSPRLTHLVLRVRDLQRSRRFYEALGLAFVEEQHGVGPVHYSCELGATVFELYPIGTRSSAPTRFGLCIDSIRAAEDQLMGSGLLDVVARSEPEGMLTLRDPDGNTIDIVGAGPT